jgi:hypothetical protein
MKPIPKAPLFIDDPLRIFLAVCSEVLSGRLILSVKDTIE